MRLVLSVVIAIILLWIILRFREAKNPRKKSLEILEERLSKGEITKAEFEEARRKQIK